MRMMTVCSGVFLIAAGIFCQLNQDLLFISFAFVVGVSLLISGVLGTLSYVVAFRRRGLPIWSLTDGLLPMVLSFIVLNGLAVSEDVLPSTLGFWVVTVGITRIAGAIDMKKEARSFRIVFLVLGVLSVVSGVYGFYYPLFSEMPVLALAGNYFIIQGVNIAVVGFGVRRKLAGEDEETAGEFAGSMLVLEAPPLLRVLWTLICRGIRALAGAFALITRRRSGKEADAETTDEVGAETENVAHGVSGKEADVETTDEVGAETENVTFARSEDVTGPEPKNERPGLTVNDSGYKNKQPSSRKRRKHR
jgi:uncharacterized membrane protein HdeD (DUF308 family)